MEGLIQRELLSPILFHEILYQVAIETEVFKNVYSNYLDGRELHYIEMLESI